MAQSRCAHGGAPLANYWVHNGFVDMGAEKMSKSLGNVITVDRLLAEGHRGEVLRLALLSGHYRSPLPWTENLIAQSKATLDGLYRTAGDVERARVDPGVLEAISDDLNTPLAMARLGALGDAGAVKASAQMLGLLTMSADEWFRGGEGARCRRPHCRPHRGQGAARLCRGGPDPGRAGGRGRAAGGRAERHDVAAGVSAPLYTRDILRLAASLASRRCSSGSTAKRSDAR